MMRPAFTRTDLLAATVTALTLISVSHVLVARPGDYDDKITNRAFVATTRLRAIHASFVFHAQGNRDYFPGLNSDGTIASLKLDADKDIVGTQSNSGADPVYRITVLLRGNYFVPSYALNPYEDKRKKSAVKPGGNVTTDHFSFAMLRIDDKSKRVGEWNSTNNSRSAIVCDRNIGKGAGKDARALSKPSAGGWEGIVIYNDNHAETAKNPLKKTDYALRGEVTNDDLFAEDKTDKGEAGADAAMVYQDAKTYVDQK